MLIDINLDVNFMYVQVFQAMPFSQAFPRTNTLEAYYFIFFILFVSDDIITFIRAYGVEREGDCCITDMENKNINRCSLTSDTVPAGVAEPKDTHETT
jgi:hypothetical protein